MHFYTLHFDGACWPNPGGIGSYGYTIHHAVDKVKEGNGVIGQWKDMTNNFAEFFALYKGLEHIISFIEIPAHLEIKGDSKLVVKIMMKKWKVRAGGEYVKAYRKAEELVKILRKKGVSVSFSWIPRKKNQRSDILSKQYQKSHLSL
jgi:ribonuclease HI